jgi:hypothetical protein
MATSTLVATVGATTANTYGTRTEANAYFEDRLHTEVWDAASDTEKDQALLWATKLLDRAFDWAQNVVDEDQALLWPRNGILDVNELSVILDSVVPDELKWAQFEYAKALITADPTLDKSQAVEGLTELTAGPVTLKFKDLIEGKLLPDMVINYIPSWWGTPNVNTQGNMTTPIERW